MLSMGDPAGIGGEIALMAWSVLNRKDIPFGILADRAWLDEIAKAIAFKGRIQTVTAPTGIADIFPTGLPVIPLDGSTVRGRPGVPDTDDGPQIVASIRQAVAHVMDGSAAAIVTNPINKKSLYDSGFRFPGHTEFIADICNAAQPVMMLASPDLRVVPVTIHLPLRDAITQLTSDLIQKTVRVVAYALRRDFAIDHPRIAVSGLNPHAGEGGSLGHEDTQFILPAIEALTADGLDVIGPIPGDAMFTPRFRTTYDASVCMYHDQALIPIKALDFDRAVNATLGLPIIRTSPDHGTAFDIAGKGIASAASLISAIELAHTMSVNRQAHVRDRP